MDPLKLSRDDKGYIAALFTLALFAIAVFLLQ